MPDQTAKVTLYMMSAHEKVVDYPHWNKQQKRTWNSIRLEVVEDETRFRFLLGIRPSFWGRVYLE